MGESGAAEAPRRRGWKGYALRAGFSLFLLGVGLVAAELVYRALLFRGGESFGSLREPSLYADPFFDDDYWKLHWVFQGKYFDELKETSAKYFHPELGWNDPYWDKESYRHVLARDIKGRRPVLLYGDSFSRAAAPDVRLYERCINQAPEFGRDHYLLNYGVGGYGLDQIYLLYTKSIGLYEAQKPFVIFSFMTLDLDRSILSFRSGQKPRFRVVDDALVPPQARLDPDLDGFMEREGPEVGSYLWRRIVQNSPVAKRFFYRASGHKAKHREKKALNLKILEAALADLRERGLDFVFVVFHPHHGGDGLTLDSGSENWRDALIRGFLIDNKVPYIWAKGLVETRSDGSIDYAKHIDPGHLHPTDFYTARIAEALKGAVLKSPLPPGAFPPGTDANPNKQ